MRYDEINYLKNEREYLEAWIKNFYSAKEILPKAQRKLDTVNWEIDALENAPTEAEEIPTGLMEVNLVSHYDYLTTAFPMIPIINEDLVSSTDALAVSGSASVFQFVSRVGDLGTYNAQRYSDCYTKKYEEIQLESNRIGEIRNLLIKLGNEGTLKRFEVSEKSYLHYKAGTGESTAAAIEMRTFLDGVKGDLFQLACHHKDENMTWEEMARRLSKGGESSLESDILNRQKMTRTSIIKRLSDIGKDRVGQGTYNLNHIWTELLDHIYTVLKVINI